MYKKIIIILFIFSVDRFSKLYFLNLEETGVAVDFYILSFLNFVLVWNTGIGFGLASLEANIFFGELVFVIVKNNLIFFSNN